MTINEEEAKNKKLANKTKFTTKFLYFTNKFKQTTE